MTKVEVKIETIIHATEDPTKIFDSFHEIFQIEREQFSVDSLMGHFENPISLVTVKFRKKEAKAIIDTLISNIPKDQLKTLKDQIDQHIHNSTVFLRISKQDLVMGRVVLKETDSIKFKVTTPVFNKKESTRIFSDLLGIKQVD